MYHSYRRNYDLFKRMTQVIWWTGAKMKLD